MISSWSMLCLTLMYIFKVSCMEEMAYNEAPGIAYNEASGIAYNEASGIAYNEASGISYNEKRPIWNIGHMVNSIWQVDEFLRLGSNSLEFDIHFDNKTGLATHVWHGVPCDCFRDCSNKEELPKYLEYLQKLTSPESPEYRKELVLLLVDCRVNKISPGLWKQAGEDLAMKLLDHYWGKSKAGAYVLISVPSIAQVDFVQSFRNTMKSKAGTTYDSKIGYDFSGNENVDAILSTYTSANIDKNIWQGDGVTNCLPRGTKRLQQCLLRRESSSIAKVYYWTVDKERTMQEVLRMGVDGIMTNHPDRLARVLNEKEFSGKLRLATLEDNPWETVPFAKTFSMHDVASDEDPMSPVMLSNCEKTP